MTQQRTEKPMIEQIEFTDRYSALGIKPPSLLTGCRGDCEATGFVPVYLSELDERKQGARLVRGSETDAELRRRALAAHAASDHKYEGGTCDGTHFVTCPSCEGTRRTRGFWPRVRQVGFWLGKKWEFARHHVLARPYTSGTAALVMAMQRDAAMADFEVGSDRQRWEGLTPYGDRLDVPHPWLWNRRIGVRVLLGRVRS